MRRDDLPIDTELSNLPALVVNEAGCVAACTPAAKQLLQVEPGEHFVRARLPEECKSRISSAIQRVIAEVAEARTAEILTIQLQDEADSSTPTTVAVCPLHSEAEQPAACIVLLLGTGQVCGREGSVGEQQLQIPAEEMVAEVAHELSRPLASVLNHTELALQDPDLPEATRLRLEAVLQQAEACRALLRRFLAIGPTRLKPIEPVQLNDVVSRTVASLKENLQDSRVEVSVSLNPRLPLVSGNMDDLEAIVRNLIENAIHAASQATTQPQVTVKTTSAMRRITITVTDNGPGIPPALQGRIFEPFVTTKGPGEGTGLGLSIVRRLVQEHAGQIRVESSPDHGTSFIVELPAEEPPIEQSRPRIRDEQSAKKQKDKQHRRALIIDDDTSMRKLLQSYLEGLDYETVEAADGHKALEECLTDEFDVIICDVKMPGMNGADFYRALRAESPKQAARVIFSTGILPIDKSDSFLRSLPNPRLQKPFRIANLRHAVEAIVGATT